MFGYLVTIATIMFLAWWYVWQRLIEKATLGQPLREVILGYFIIAYVLFVARWLFKKARGDLSWLIGPAYFSFGLISQLFIVTILNDIVFYTWRFIWPESFQLHQEYYMSWSCWILFFLCLSANIWGAYNAFDGPEIKEIDIDLVGNKGESEEIRIVQISDLHVGPLIRRSYVADVVRKCQSLKPDLIVITGDLGDGQPESIESEFEPFKDLQASMGIYYITGNHEYYWKVDQWIHLSKKLGLQILFNEGVLLKNKKNSFWLGGVPDISAKHMRKDHPHMVEESLQGAPENVAKILLAHQPRSCFDAEKFGYDYMMCGHTHGGQYIPYTWIIKYMNPYNVGYYQHGKLQLYVNAGTGFWGPPLRLGVLSEITLHRVKV